MSQDLNISSPPPPPLLWDGIGDEYSQGLIDPQSGERACNSVYACRDGWLLKIKPNVWVGGKGSCAVCVDLQAVGTLEFFGELFSFKLKVLTHL